MSIIIGIDPGPTEQSCVMFDSETNQVLKTKTFNAHEFESLGEWCYQYQVAIEWIESFGMAVGQEVFRTVFQIGRMKEVIGSVRLIPRRDVKLTVCGSARAKDANIRQSLIDTLGVVGTKKDPGPLFGVAGHYWAALGVAYTASCFETTEHEALFHVENK